MNNKKIDNVIKDHVGYVELVDSVGDDLRIVNAARVSYNRESKGDEADKKLLDYLAKHGHFGPFEHVVFTFKIKCPIIVVRQWHRHRTWSYNEISRRYVSEDVEFYYPETWRKQDTVNKQSSVGEFEHVDKIMFNTMLVESVNKSYETYQRLLEEGVSREMARMVMPQNLYTTFYGTVNLRNLFGFLEQRLDKHAQWEIRQYAEAILSLIKPIVPWSVDSWAKHSTLEVWRQNGFK